MDSPKLYVVRTQPEQDGGPTWALVLLAQLCHATAPSLGRCADATLHGSLP